MPTMQNRSFRTVCSFCLACQFHTTLTSMHLLSPRGWSDGHLVLRKLRLSNHTLHERETVGSIAQRQSDYFDKHKLTISDRLIWRQIFVSFSLFSTHFWPAVLLIQPPSSCPQLCFPHSLYLTDIYDKPWDHSLPEGVIWLNDYGRTLDHSRCIQHKVAFLPGLIYYWVHDSSMNSFEGVFLTLLHKCSLGQRNWWLKPFWGENFLLYEGQSQYHKPWPVLSGERWFANVQ